MGPVERFVAGALRQQPFVLLVLAAYVVTGVVAWREVPVEAFPDLTNNQVVVVTAVVAEAVEALPVGRTQHVDVTLGAESLQVAVDRGEPDAVALLAQVLEDLLGGAEVVDAPELGDQRRQCEHPVR